MASKSYQGGSLEGLGGPVNVDPYHFGGIDPTLDACCQREIESNRKYNALTSTLRRHDVAALAERRRRNLVTTPSFDGCRCCYDPSSDGHGEYTALLEYKQKQVADAEGKEENIEQEKAEEAEADSDDDSDDEFDYLLDEDLPGDDGLKELEDQRRAELEFEMLKRQVALQHGYGTHRQLHPSRVLKAAGLAANPARSPPPAVVLHLVDPDSIASASLDYYLESELAAKHPGTIFMRSGGRSTLLMDAPIAQKAFRNELQADRDMPSLVAIKDGVVSNICPRLRELCHEEGGPVEPRAVEMWLGQSGVLRPHPPAFDTLCYIRPEEEALMDYLAQQKPMEDERYDCGLEGCSKTFPHEHVGIQTSEQSGLVVKEETILGE
eukprot:CAMPEP_0176009164 /NCGR_PEP_ID=MMETSP0120_2-20121206/4113_1 /TAXON_ID=160619 /ORGANISM="Kryptoperidinium foliaceum, Strain CCMP 1326" /LENGTH=379 /DNA_ID=CAMNT_0017341959 /DNA_START=23 /DNA_END=1162 /DNA_ORIENTATION=+